MIPACLVRPRRTRSAVRRRWTAVALVPLATSAALSVAGACGPAGDRASEDRAETTAEDPGSPHLRAAYLTSLTFVGFEASPSVVHFRFANLADRNRLALSYQGWVAGRDAWSPLLQVEDTIPVARGAWRVVPTRELRLRVGRGAQIDALRIPVESETLRVEALDVISSWSSATGQRETLRSAELLLGPGAEAGLLLQRRRARPLESERASVPTQAFVLTDTIGDGLIVLRNRAVPDAPATVWAWLDGERIEWTDALLLALATPEGAPGRWTLEVAREGIVVEIEGTSPVLDTTASTGSSYRLHPVRATLSVGESRRTMAGVALEDDGP